jgi:hypothetical protein
VTEPADLGAGEAAALGPETVTGPETATAGPEVTPPASAAQSPPPVVGVRQLLGASFDLLLRAGDPVRRASFYIGLLVLGTVGPLALAMWGLLVGGYRLELLFGRTLAPGEGWFLGLIVLMVAGIIVASIESIGVAIALLGAEVAGRPITVREAVQRSRMTFWWIVVATLIVSIPTTLIQDWIGQTSQVGLVLGLAVAILIQTPFVYMPAGIVLGGVGPIEALKRSVRIAAARKVAAVLLAVLPTVYGLLILVAFEAGVDLAIRTVEALGLGTDSGPAGIAIVTVLILMVVFALGTLLFTASAIIYAPQVVMFVGLTRATMGLDAVRPGGRRAVDRSGAANPPFRWLTRPMLLAFAFGGLALAGFLTSVQA